LMANQGFEGEAQDIARAWKAGDREAAIRAVSDAMINETSIAGTPEYCLERLDRYRQSGVDLPIISPFARGPAAKQAFETAIRACAPRN